MEDKATVVIGGGVIGLLTAWYLVASGRSVVVVEKGQVGQESSWAGGGILFPLYPDRYPVLAPLVMQSCAEYPRIVSKATQCSGIDPQWIQSGLLLLDELATSNDSDLSLSGKAIDGTTLMHLEPGLARDRAVRARYYPAAQVRNPRLLSALQRTLLTMGVIFRESCEVTGFQHERGRLTGLHTSTGPLGAGSCVVATGAWSGQVLGRTGLALPIKPIRGQMIVFAPQAGLISHILVQNYRYLIPRSDGRILVGSTVEDVGFDKHTTDEACSALFQWATELVPALARARIEHHWAGLRPGSPDDTPFIGEHPAIKGLFVCAGHHRNGFATGPASARLVSDLLLGREPTLDASPFRLNRDCPDWPVSVQN